jgi:molybdenum cofactor guanylyltransferase
VTDLRDPLSEDVVGVILAGGRSRRMGTEKTRLPVGGQSMMERAIGRLGVQASSLVVSVSEDAEPAVPPGVPVARDEGERFGGPLFGILSGLKWANDNTNARWILSAPADAPFLPSDLVSRLREGLAADAEIAIARSLGRLHPVVALWPVSLAEALEAWLAVPSQRAVKAWLATRRWSAVDFPCEGGIDPFFNVNTPEDLAGAQEQAGRST